MAAFDGVNGPTISLELYKRNIETWVPVTATDIKEISFTRGRTRADQPMVAGNATVVLDNITGKYDPDYTVASTWVVSGVSVIRDGLRGRIIATWDEVEHILFVGKMETANVDAGFEAKVSINFVDGLAGIAAVEMPTLKSFLYLNETTSTRVGRILTAAGWPIGDRSLTGTLAMQSTIQGANALTMIEQCVKAQAGAFYISKTGIATLERHTAKFSKSTLLDFNDNRAADTIEYDNIMTSPGTLQVINEAILTRGKMKEKRAKHKSSITKYGLKTLHIEAFIQSETKAQNLAIYYAYKDAIPKTTVTQIQFGALALDVLYPDFLSCELQDQVTVKRKTVDGRDLTMHLVIEGMSHVITPKDWRVTFNTSPMNQKNITL